MAHIAKSFAAIALFMLSTASMSAEFYRWTAADQSKADLSSTLAELNRRTGFNFQSKDFHRVEDRDLAYSHYSRYLQVKHGVAIDSASVRIWSDIKTNAVIQIEANVESPSQVFSLASVMRADGKDAVARVKRTLESQPLTHGKISDIKRQRVWQGTRLVEIATLTTNRGVEKIIVDALTGALISKTFKPHASVDEVDEFSMHTHAYPVYEEYNGVMLSPVPTELKYLKSTVRLPTKDLYSRLRYKHFYYRKMDEYKASTAEGRAAGYWSFPWLRTEVARSASAVAPVRNAVDANGLFLDGRFATVSIHPSALDAFGPFSFKPHMGEHVIYDWRPALTGGDWEMVPMSTFRGRPWMSTSEVTNPVIVRDPQNDPKAYIENGFDQIQVYYSITTLFDALRPMGFTDPEMSERPFNAFLYYPDIEWKNNAFYTNDTINFTTYSPNEANMARDNTTIWHELGHGVMDRLMGEELNLADTGGLSEGMADFVALLVIEATQQGQAFPGSNDLRIINNTGFFLTNEVHDDGEAYGGAMKEILDAAIVQWGRQGLNKVADLVLEAMRLSRDHPHLTADDWFMRMRFADELGREGLRAPHELGAIINNALVSRNFGGEAERVNFALSYEDNDVVAGSAGSRDNEIPVTLGANETAAYPLKISLTDGSSTELKYPVTVKVVYEGGPLQGPINWVGEKNGAQTITLDGPASNVDIPLALNGKCESINRDDGSCTDYVYVQVFENGASKPIGKKRFYLRLKTR